MSSVVVVVCSHDQKMTMHLANISVTSAISVTIADSLSHRRLECAAPAASGLFPADDYAASTRISLMRRISCTNQFTM